MSELGGEYLNERTRLIALYREKVDDSSLSVNDIREKCLKDLGAAVAGTNAELETIIDTYQRYSRAKEEVEACFLDWFYLVKHLHWSCQVIDQWLVDKPNEGNVIKSFLLLTKLQYTDLISYCLRVYHSYRDRLSNAAFQINALFKVSIKSIPDTDESFDQQRVLLESVQTTKSQETEVGEDLSVDEDGEPFIRILDSDDTR